MKLIEKFSIISIPEKPLNYVKSLFTWKGRGVNQIKEENFLSHSDWKHNLKTLSEFTAVTPTYALMSKEIYLWLPNNSCVAEGFTNLKERMQQLSSESYTRWLTTGSILGLSYLFIRAMQFNLNCLDEFDIIDDSVGRECRSQFAEMLKQPGNIAKVAVAGGAWAFTGWLINNLGDFGLRGRIKQSYHHTNLVKIYQATADSARETFWKAYDCNDRETTQEIYNQLSKIKIVFPYLKEIISTEFNVDDAQFKKIINPLKFLIEEVQDYDKHTTNPTNNLMRG